jgi:hypothetical protein
MVTECCDETGMVPGVTKVIGDAVYDMQMAKAAGATAIGVSWGYASVQDLWNAGADAVVDHILRELPAHIGCSGWNLPMRDILSDLSDATSDPDPVRRAQIQMKRPLAEAVLQARLDRPRARAAMTVHARRSAGPHAGQAAARPSPRRALPNGCGPNGMRRARRSTRQKMPVTRLVNTALDGVARRSGRGQGRDRPASPAPTCSATAPTAPERLVAIQQGERWDPLLEWAAAMCSAHASSWPKASSTRSSRHRR